MDCALRELNRQALDTSRSIVVSACAGSGKTWLLVSRIIRLLLAGVAPSQILAITFTRRAAQEMAGRLRDWLRLLATADDAAVREFLEHREVPRECIDRQLGRARELFEEVLVAEPPITIATFHSWFLQILRNAPLEAGAYGAITLTDRPSTFVDRAWEQLMTSCRSARDSAEATAIEALFRDFGLENTRRLLRSFVGRRAEWWAFAGERENPVAFALDRISQRLAVAPDVDVIASLLSDRAFMADLQALARLLVRNDATSRKRADAVLEALGGAHAQAAAFDAIRNAVLTDEGEPRSIRATRALLDLEGAGAGARLQQLLAAAQTRVAEAVSALADQACYRTNAAGLTAGAALLANFQAVKRERQIADFADIEWLAFQLLARGEHAVTLQFRLDSRYRHILLDEFQDTNPLQWLALRAWLDAAGEAGEPPALFIVGDPKQSIYRFRRAEPQLFAAASRFIAERGGVTISQDESFRCARAVLEVVNQVFASQPLFAPYNAHAAHHRRLPGRVEVQALAQRDAPTANDTPGTGATVLRNPLVTPVAIEEDLRRLTEARAFASRLREIVAAWNVAVDARASAVRPARFGDIMALVRRRTHLAVYERALRSANVPYITSRQGGLLDTLEAEDLSALLQFLVSPFDDLRLAHALHSPIFSLTDDDLIAIARTPGKTWWERLVDLAAAGGCTAIERAATLLAQWRGRADTQPVHDQLDRIYCEGDVMRRYDAAVPAAMRAAVAANLEAYIQHALDTDSGRYPSLPRFIAELHELRAAPVEEAPDEGVLGTHGDAVRLLTIHGAKGLEAPIVWLLDAAAPRVNDAGFDALIDWPSEARAPENFSLWTRFREQSAQQRSHALVEEQRAQREDLNLLYVAMTRAQQALIVSGCEVRGWESSWYMHIRNAVADLTGQDARAVASGIAHGDDFAVDARVESEPADDLPGPGGPASYTVSPTGIRRPVVQGTGQAFGTVFHRLMECLTAQPNRSAESVRRELRLPAKGFDVLWSRARALLNEPSLARFFDPLLHRRALNELAIVTAAGDLRRLDRVVEFDDEVWVLDYKTGSYSNVVGTALESEYRSQIEAYCDALRGVYAEKTVRGGLLFADGLRLEI